MARELVQYGGTIVALAVKRAISGDPACLAACVTLLGSVSIADKSAEPSKGKGND